MSSVGNEQESHRPRLAVVVSHPIQYYAPYYRAIAADRRITIKTFYCSRLGLDKTLDPGMGIELAWQTDLLSGYDHEFLPEALQVKTTQFWDVNNPSVVSRLEAYGPDVVLVHGYAHATLWRAILWCCRRGVPLMNISDRSLFGPTTRLRKLVRSLVLPLILKQYTAFLVISDPVHEFYATHGAQEEQIFRVPNMLDDSFWRCRERKDIERARVRAELGVNDEDFVVLYVGKFVPWKRPADLLAALEILRQRESTKRRVRLVLAGDGQLRGDLMARAQAGNLPVVFLGFVNIDKLPSYYSAADALAHPSESESFGMIVLEATVFGLPVVVSDGVGAVGPTSIARPGKNAIIHPRRDPAAIADALQRLANEPDTCARMAEASLRFSQDHEGPMSVDNTVAAVNYCLEMRSGATRTRFDPQTPG